MASRSLSQLWLIGSPRDSPTPLIVGSIWSVNTFLKIFVLGFAIKNSKFLREYCEEVVLAEAPREQRAGPELCTRIDA